MNDLKIAQTLATMPRWMEEDATCRVMSALNRGHNNAMFVGGCVRNQLLGAPVDDIDIATKLTPEKVMERLQKAEMRVIPTGIDHGTVTAVYGGRSFEITTLRKDVDTDGRHAEVEYSADWVEDARRRDFTMNTLLADASGHIYDPLGRGLAALRSRKVEFVGSPERRIKEDYLRILRYFRFFALYGHDAPDEAALAACRANAQHVYDLSKERITQEFFKILAADKAADILGIMFDNGVLDRFAFAQYAPDLMRAVSYFQKHYELVSVAARLWVLAGFKEDNIGALQEFLLIPKVFQKDIKAISDVQACGDLNDPQILKEAIYRYGRTAAAQGVMIALAEDKVMNNEAGALLRIVRDWDVPVFPLSGQDLIAEGMKPGPELGRKLDELEQAWIDDGFES